MSDLQLITGGTTYAGWKSIRVNRGMEQCAGGFELSVTELWSGNSEPSRILAGASCKVIADGETVITGYVDEVTITVDGRQHTVDIYGRDATADLVDCSAIRKTGQWRGLKVEQIAQELCDPFHIKVRTEVETGKPLPSFAIQEGETVFEALDRAARIRALLLVTDGLGNLVITQASKALVPTALVLGQNMLAATGTLNLRDRYSQYFIKGQAAGPYFDGAHDPKVTSQMKAMATDAAMPRYRPLIVTAETQDLAVTLQTRAKWEASVRAARSVDVNVKVQGWSHSGGLWRPNTLVHVSAPPLRLDDDLLIRSVRYSLDEKGSVAELSLTRADAYSLLPVKGNLGQDPSNYLTGPRK